MKVEIKKVSVGAYRNLTNAEFNLGGKNTAFVGNNAIGKTNMLNAILWCLTGADLEDRSTSWCDVPYNTTFRSTIAPGERLMEVEVEMNVGKVKRSVYQKGEAGLTTKVEVNDVVCDTLLNAETAIDKMLGILPLTINQTKGFNIRKFLLNPNYFTKAKESTLREFLISQLDTEKEKAECFEKYKKVIQKAIKEYCGENLDIIAGSTKVAAKIRSIKKDIEKWTLIKAFLEKNLPDNTNVLETVSKSLELAKKDRIKAEECECAITMFGRELSNAYYTRCFEKFGIQVDFLEKGTGDDVWKEICDVRIDKDTSIKYGSTAEKIINGCGFIRNFIKGTDKLEPLPLLFDECETLDNNSIASLFKSMNTQLITAKVQSGIDKLKMEEIK